MRTMEPTTPPGASTLTLASRITGLPARAACAAAVASQAGQVWETEPARAPCRAVFSTMDSPYRYIPNCIIPRNITIR